MLIGLTTMVSRERDRRGGCSSSRRDGRDRRLQHLVRLGPITATPDLLSGRRKNRSGQNPLPARRSGADPALRARENPWIGN